MEDLISYLDATNVTGTLGYGLDGLSGGLTAVRGFSEHWAPKTWEQILLTALVVFILSRVVKSWQGLMYATTSLTVSYLPGIRTFFDPLDVPGAAIPTSWWNPGLDFPWNERFNIYQKYGSETISVVPSLVGIPSVYTSNLEVARQVVAGGIKSSWVKPWTASRALLLWGMNLVASEKETWRRHRRIMGPAFNHKTYALVWDQTIKIYRDMIASEGWADTDVIDVPVVQKLTFKFALLVISACGFGVPYDWATPPTAPDGAMTVQEALRIVTDSTMFSISAPNWVKNLPIGWIREIRTANRMLQAFMHAQVANRRTEIRAQLDAGDEDKVRSDVFSMLVRANEEEGKYPLEDSELIGNVFVLLFAGHETSAHTLAATLGFLSLHQDIQDEVAAQILDVVGPERDPKFEDYNALDKVLAAFYEALRMFPAGSLLIRQATEDTFLEIPNPVGQEGSKTLLAPKGMQVVVDMVGIQYNPRYFPDPGEYRPSRWYASGDPTEARDPDAFTAFSVGPRTCIGRKFATTEVVCWLTLLLRDFRVEPALRPGESEADWRERVLQGKMLMTLSVLPVPVRFVRRKT